MFGACWYKTSDSLSCVTVTSDGTSGAAATDTGLTVTQYYENIYGNAAFANQNDAYGVAVTSLTPVTEPSFVGFDNYWYIDSTATTQQYFLAWLVQPKHG